MGKRSTTPKGGRGTAATGIRRPPEEQDTLDPGRKTPGEKAEEEIEQSHKEYAENAKITDDQGERMDQRRRNVVDKLKNRFRIKESHIYGSVLQDNQTGPLDEDSDVDVLIVLDREEHTDWAEDPNGPRNCLRAVKNALEKEYPGREIYIDRNVVAVEFSDFTVEVTPAFEHSHIPDPEPPGDPVTVAGIELPGVPPNTSDPDNGYAIPDTYNQQSWIPANPRKFQAMYDAVNEGNDGKLQKVAVTAKKWNNENGKPVGSFHMVNMAMKYFQNDASEDASLNQHMGKFFQNLPRYIRSETREPVYQERLDRGMSRKEKREATKKAWEARNKIREAHRLKKEGKTEEAKEKYREVYGDDFK